MVSFEQQTVKTRIPASEKAIRQVFTLLSDRLYPWWLALANGNVFIIQNKITGEEVVVWCIPELQTLYNFVYYILENVPNETLEQLLTEPDVVKVIVVNYPVLIKKSIYHDYVLRQQKSISLSKTYSKLKTSAKIAKMMSEKN